MPNSLLKEGDIIEIKKDMKVYINIPKHFYYTNTFGDFECTSAEVVIGSVIKGWDTSNLAGRYIVTSTSMTGGGTGMGPHDVYPDGHLVKCQMANQPLMKLSFYQTGSFTAMITDIEPVGKATATWEEADASPTD